MSYLTTAVASRIGIVTISRPEALNALTFDLAEQLAATWRSWESTGAVDAIVLQSEGEKAFVAGADIAELDEKNSAEMLQKGMQDSFRTIRTSSIPSVVAVQGLALGGGFELAMSCDIRVASPNASFGLPETGLGIIPGAGGTQMLSRYAGISMANYHILTGIPMTAERALQVGLVGAIYPAPELRNEAFNLAQKIQGRGPLATRLAKLAIRSSADTSFDAGLELELLAQASLFGTQQPKEGFAAFGERRKPDFRR